MRPALFLAAILSGAAGLAYQVAWTRRIVSVTSATASAQALVLAVFMAGLGLGAYLAGRRAARSPRPLIAYAKVELVAALFAIASLPILDASDGVRDALTVANLGAGVALYGQLAALSLFLLVPCVFMGASLPFLVEHLVAREGANAGRTISILYGVNTLGAAGGTLVAGFVTIEAYGLSSTVRLGVVCALVAAGIAVALGRGPARASTMGETIDHRTSAVLLAAAAAGGFVGFSAETLWTRLVSLVVLTTVYAYSQVIAAVLVGVVLGALGSAVLLGRTAEEAVESVATRAAAIALAIGAVATAVGPEIVRFVAADRMFENVLARGLSAGGLAFLFALVVPAAACTAACLPLLVAAAKSASGADTFGRLYAANAFGSIAGSLVAGFVLLPAIGTGAALAVTELVALVTAFALAFRLEDRRPVIVVVALATLTAGALYLGQDVPRDIYALRVPPGTEILEFDEGTHSDVMVTENAEGRRRIWINSAWVAGTGGGHRSLGHVPALFVEEPRTAAGIALGTGQTFAAALSHDFDAMHCIEIDPGVIRLSKRWFAQANRGLFDDPRVHVHTDDGRAYLRTTDERFDLIVLEPLQAWSAGTSNLYSVEFYEDARRALAPGGVVAQWIPFYGQDVRQTRAMVRAGLEVFPEASLWLDTNDGILVLGEAPFAIDPDALRSRIRSRGIAPDLAKNHLADTRDLLSLFLAGPRGLARWTEGAPLLVDDHPFLEFSAARDVGVVAYGTILGSLSSALEPPAAYVTGSSTVADAALAIRTAALAASTVSPSEALAPLEAGLAKVPGDALLSYRYEQAILRIAEKRSGNAMALYERALSHAPGLGRVSVNLALALARANEFERARATLAPVLNHPRVGRVARELEARLPRP